MQEYPSPSLRLPMVGSTRPKISLRVQLTLETPPSAAGTRVSASSLAALEDGVSEVDDASACWLQQAFVSGPRTQATHAVHAQRHALQDHVPALVGPLSLTTPGEGPLDRGLAGVWEDDEDCAEALLVTR